MSATRQHENRAAPATPAAATDSHGLGDASLPEALQVLLTGVVPALVRGLFAPRRSAMKLLTAIDADARAVATLAKLRRKHDGQGLKLLGGRLAILWGESAIREVLDRSADVYAGDSGAKAKGMSHFQPDALTLSRGEAWRDRRAFNEAVLATPERVHPSAPRFLTVIAEEAGRMQLTDTLDWAAWEQLFDHLTLRIIFGDGARGDQELTSLLEKLMGEANRLVGLSHTDNYYELYGRLERKLNDPEPETLIARLASAPHTDSTRIVQQIPHWMFAMRDTLAANTFRALAAIVADQSIEQRVRAEMAGKDLAEADAIDGLRYLEGCLQEAMRLWPTTPLLARETTRDTTLAGEHLKEGSQVMLINVFNHRDPDHVEDADRMVPERWGVAEREDADPMVPGRTTTDARDYRFNHLSNGTQDCPGGSLVLLLGKAVIARVLERYELHLDHPHLASPLPHMLDFFETRFAAKA